MKPLRLALPIVFAAIILLAVVTAVSALDGSALTGGWWTTFESTADNELWNLRGPDSGIDASGLYADWPVGTEAWLGVYHAGGDFIIGAKPTADQGLGSTTYIKFGLYDVSTGYAPLDNWGSSLCNTGSLFSLASANEYRQYICEDLPAGYYVLRHKAAGSQRRYVREIHTSADFAYYWTPENPTPGEPSGPTLGAAVPITTTCSILQNGVTNNYNANLVDNWSFEQATASQFVPDDWEPTSNAGAVPAAYQQNKLDAVNGEDYLNNADAFVIETQVSIPQTGTYLFGAHVRGDIPVETTWAGYTFNATPVSTTEWIASERVITIDTVGGSPGKPKNTYVYELGFSTGGDVAIDAVYVVPVTYTAGITNTGTPTDTSGLVVNCPAFQNPITSTGTVTPGEPIYVPTYPWFTGNNNAVCTTCPIPQLDGLNPAAMLGYMASWVAWLGCQIRNLIMCFLWVWLQNIIQASGAIFSLLATLQNALVTLMSAVWSWAVNTWNNFGAWLGDTISNALEWGWEITEDAWNGAIWLAEQAQGGILWAYVWLQQNFAIGAAVMRLGWMVGQLLADILFGIGESLFQFSGALWEVVNVVRDSFGAQPYEIIINTSGEETGTVNPAELYNSGVNGTKVLWVVFLAIGAVDYFITQFPSLQVVMWLSIGVMAFGLVLWTMKLWEDPIKI